MTHKSTWKKSEGRIADYFGTTRTPLSGGNSKITRSDTLHNDLFIEAKLRVEHAAVNLWDKVKEMADEEDKIPVVALAVKGRPKEFWLVIHKDHLGEVEHCRIGGE